MKSKIFLILLLLISAGVLKAASRGKEVYFPKIKGWKLDVSSKVYTPDNLWDLINGAAESYLSYDFLDLHLATYKCKCGIEIHTEIYRHSTKENAYGIYSSERSPEYNFIEIGTQGYQDIGILNFFSGQYYIKLYSTWEDEQVAKALADIGKAISDHLGEENTWPEQLDLFPPQGKIPNKDNFIRENFIGFNFLHSAFTAEYEGGYRLFVIQADDHAEILEMVRAYIKFTKQDTDPVAKASFVIKDKYNGDIPIVIKDAYLLGIIDGADNEEALAGLQMMVEKLPVKEK